MKKLILLSSFFLSGIICSAQVPASGSMPYRTNSYSTTYLPIGSPGQVLTVNPGGTAPIWSVITIDTTKLLHTSGTYSAYPLTGPIVHSNNGNNAISSKQGYGFNIGYGDSLKNSYSSNHQYSVDTWDSLQNYKQFYDNTTGTGSEVNLAGSNGAGGNGTYAHISGVNNVKHSEAILSVTDSSIVISGFVDGVSNTLPGIQESYDMSPNYKGLSLTNNNYVKSLITAATSGTPLITNVTNLSALTTATTVATYTTLASGGTFKVGGYLTPTAIATDVINLQIVFTDETNTSRTVTMPSVSTTGYNSQSEITFNAKASTVITISTVLTTGIGSITYDVGSTLIQVK